MVCVDWRKELRSLRLAPKTLAVLAENQFVDASDLELLTREDVDKLDLPIRDAAALRNHIFGAAGVKGAFQLPSYDESIGLQPRVSAENLGIKISIA